MGDNFTGVPVLLHRQNYVRVRAAAIKQMFQLLELLFNMAANCRCDFNVPPRVFKRHSGFYLPRSLGTLSCQPNPVNLRGELFPEPSHDLYTTARRSREPGILI